MLDRLLTFPRHEIGSCLYATSLDPTPTAGRIAVPAFGSCLHATILDPTPTAGLTAVPAFSGVRSPPRLLVLNLPPVVFSIPLPV